ncbi:MAG: helix-hairpin-helix domain-containing protein [Bacillota bacterium]|nr:helix-hairpin-helix domain-containing protein [Bacillota bacterium]
MRALRSYADGWVLLGEEGRAMGYRRAAASLDRWGKMPSEEDLTQVPGIGPGLAATLAALLEGREPAVERELRERIPQGVWDLLELPGVGPGTARTLWTHGIASPKELAQVSLGQLMTLPGLGEKKARALKDGAKAFLERPPGYLLGKAWPVAETIKGVFRQKGFALWEGGALRRREPVVEKILLVGALPQGGDVQRILEILAGEAEEGPFGFKVEGSYEGVSFEVRWVRRASFGWALYHWTDPQGEKAPLPALPQGFPAPPEDLLASFDPFGLKPLPAEEAVFSFLKKPWMFPEIRAFPQRFRGSLVTLSPCQGELHAHTTESDGADSLEAMAAGARERGYRYLAITDHSAHLKVARGLDEERLRRQQEAIGKLQGSLKDLVLLHGTEADILPGGALDVPPSLSLDWVVAAIHSQFQLSPSEMTARILRALSSGKVDVLGHPTGRLLGRRPSYEADWEKIFQKAREMGVAMEINANPMRLDLPASLALAALQEGLPLAINTDAHRVEDLDLRIFGVWQARRAGARPEDVVNTWSLEAIGQWRAERG